MTQGATAHLEKRRIRTSIGRYFEEFAVGDIYEHRPGRTITDADNINFSLMTMNQHPMQCDAAFAAQSKQDGTPVMDFVRSALIPDALPRRRRLTDPN
jgi:acyl dehydratase